MAINIDTLKTRALTSLVFVAVMMVGLLWNRWSLLVLFTIIHFGCWYEFLKLLRKIHSRDYPRYIPLGLLYITMPVLLFLNLSGGWGNGTGLNTPSYLGNTIPVLIIFSCWVNDTMAYLVGSFIGENAVLQNFTKKTWEGTIGGAILCVVAIGFIFPIVAEQFFYPLAGRQTCFIVAAICAVFGTAGDLLESKLKRMADIKDSGNILPGHGGFLDRFDSLLVATPFVWVYIKIFVSSNWLAA